MNPRRRAHGLAPLLRSWQPGAHFGLGWRRRWSRGRGIRLVKLDIAAAAIRSRRPQFTRREIVSIAEAQSEPVVPTGFAIVLQPDSEPDAEAARAAVDYAFSTDVTGVGKRRVHEVPGDARAF